jgi:ABC-type Mn2+/Zn2+ transport system permease subunit
MIDWLVEPLSQPFMQRVLFAAVLAVVTTSLVGTWVVLRGLSFMGDALAHGVTPGIALAFVAGFDLTVGAVASAVVMILGIDVVHRRAGLREDTGIGLLFVGMLALGVIVMSRLPDFTSSLADVLFGDTLGVRDGDIVLQAVAAVVTTVAVVGFYRAFLVLSFNEQKARMLGLRPRLSHLLMLSLLTGAIVTSFRTVGTLLVFALIVAPPATASLVARRVPVMMVAAIGFGSVAVTAGLLLSWHLDTAAGATMAAATVVLFFVVLTGQSVFAAARTVGRGS